MNTLEIKIRILDKFNEIKRKATEMSIIDSIKQK